MAAIFKFITKISDFLQKITKHLCLLLTATIVVIVSANVVFRYVFMSPLGWVDETARCLLVWLTFIGGGLALIKGSHVGVEAIIHLFSRKTQRFLVVFQHLCILVFVILLFKNGISLVYLTKNQIIPTLGISTSWLYLAVPTGAALMILYLLDSLIRNMIQSSSRAI